MPGEVSFRPTMDDYVVANRAWFWRALLTRRYVLTIVIGAVCVAAIGIFLTRQEPDRHLRLIVPAAMCGGFVLFMLVMTALNYLFQPRVARRLFRQHRALNRDFHFAWDDTGTRFTAENGHNATPWHDYHGWYDGRGVTLLMLNDRLFHFIPHRALTPAQLTDLRGTAPRAGEAHE